MSERRFEFATILTAQGLGPPDARTMQDLWQIVDEGVLGASVHVRIGVDLIQYLIQSDPDPGRALRTAIAAADFLTATRGLDTPVIGNSMALLLKDFEIVPPEHRCDELAARAAAFKSDMDRRKRDLVAHAIERLHLVQTVFAFDYSSTVAAIVIGLGRLQPNLTIVVPESRSIAGGLRYLLAFAEAGLTIRYLPDAAIEFGLGLSDVVLLGVETLRDDGSFLNTIGSRMVARLARVAAIDVYGCTDLLKLDRRNSAAAARVPAMRNYNNVLLQDIHLPPESRISTVAPELEVVPGELTTALLTEFGPVRPDAIGKLGERVFGPLERHG